MICSRSATLLLRSARRRASAHSSARNGASVISAARSVTSDRVTGYLLLAHRAAAHVTRSPANTTLSAPVVTEEA